MRGHPAITVNLFLTWTAGVLAYGLVNAGPPDPMMATRRDCTLVFDADGGGHGHTDTAPTRPGRGTALRGARRWRLGAGWVGEEGEEEPAGRLTR